MNSAVAARLGADSTYFYLSYTHVPPVIEAKASDGADDQVAETNYWVKKFYGKLLEAVARRANAPARIGFCDADLPAGSDWNEVLPRALGSAEVLVPLYAPGYFSRSWSMSEWDSFDARLTSAHAPNPANHICPVLWLPLASDEGLPYLDRAQGLGEGIPPYADEGLLPMVRLQEHSDGLARIVDNLAAEIVRVAEKETIGPSSAPRFSEITERKIHQGTPFLVSVLAPTRDALPKGRRDEPYGDTSLQWRPFADAPPAAVYASNVVEYLNLDSRREEFATEGHLFDRNPGLVLVDPWIFARAGRRRFEDALAGLPAWVGIVVVVDDDDPQYDGHGAGLARRIEEVLSSAGRQVGIARNLDEFVSKVRLSIVLAQNAYFRNGPTFPPPGPHPPLPRLTDNDTATQSGDNER